MQTKKVTDSGAATKDAVPVHEAGIANTAQRGPAYHKPGMYRGFHHELGKDLFGGLRANDDLGAVCFNREASPGDLGARRGVDLLGGLNRSATNEPGAFALQAGLGAGRGWDLRREDPTNDPGAVYYNSGADLVGLGVLPPAAATDVPAGAVNYYSCAFAQQPDLGVGLKEDLLGVPRRADKEGMGAVYYHSDSHADKATGGPVAAVGRNKTAAGGALAGHGRRFLPFMGVLAASSAVTGLAAGTASPAAAFGLFVLLLGGISLVTLSALGA